MTTGILTALGAFNNHVFGVNVQLFYLILIFSVGWTLRTHRPFEVHIPPQFELYPIQLHACSESITIYWKAANQTFHVGCSLGCCNGFRRSAVSCGSWWGGVFTRLKWKHAPRSSITLCYVNDSGNWFLLSQHRQKTELEIGASRPLFITTSGDTFWK